MRCPVCPSSMLDPLVLDSGLAAHRCAGCDGVFLLSSEYRAWVAGQPGPTPERDDPEAGQLAQERVLAKSCPGCRHLMQRYRVSLRIPFTLDHCGRCHSVWLDTGEWASLKRRNLHDDLHRMVAEPWQRQLYKAARRAQRAARCAATPAAGRSRRAAELRRIKAWIRAHSPRR
ncbi:MAG TPA: zf-TFIIB domain-containing protein [Herpetosiphonaceae bacterium]|nr:zf-TFIIB domain-containing protein [Herpetosiphonaceae bacterium]